MNEILPFVEIVVICYLIGAGLKAIGNETLDKFIPWLCGAIGGGLAVIVFNTIPNLLPATNWLTALAIGIVSGLAATGANQLWKQFTKEEYVSLDTTDEDLPLDEGEDTDEVK